MTLDRSLILEFKPYRRKLGRTRPGPIEFRDNAPKYLKKKEHYYFWYDMMAVGEDTFVIAIANNDKNLIGGTLIPSDPTDLGKAESTEGDQFKRSLSRLR